jgi:parallel beta-helix repeat protein
VDIREVLENNEFDRAVVVSGSAIQVPAIFSSIQDGINAASPNQTVEVFAGTYDESLVIDKSLALIGAGSANTTLTFTGSPAVEELVNVDTGGDQLPGGLTIEGFTFLYAEGIAPQDGFDILLEVQASGTPENQIIIKENIFQGNGEGRTGIETAAGFAADHLIVRDNEFDQLKYGAFFNTLRHAQIEDNVFTDSQFSSTAVNTGAEGVTHNILIADNEILRTGTAEGFPEWSAGILLGSTVNDTQIIGNTVINGHDHGIYVMDRGSTAMEDVQVIFNDISNNELGTHNELDVPLIAILNFWGDDRATNESI